jgi:hypothetical protein
MELTLTGDLIATIHLKLLRLADDTTQKGQVWQLEQELTVTFT